MTVKRKGRTTSDLRPAFFGLGFCKNAQGSCFVKFGDTHVLCTATIEDKVPPFLRNTGKGWIHAEYGMLPCSSSDRIEREAVRGKQTGRTQEIQRLIGRSLRAVLDAKALGERQIKVDCDVLQADGGTRTASISGAYLAVCQALDRMHLRRALTSWPLTDQIAAISCGIVDGEVLLDMDYSEDSNADVDGNFILTASGQIVEIQANAEKKAFSNEQLQHLLVFAKKGCETLFALQKESLQQLSSWSRFEKSS
jgi:ribonuclease PH